MSIKDFVFHNEGDVSIKVFVVKGFFHSFSKQHIHKHTNTQTDDEKVPFRV
jgi:hypothetical protein